MSGGDDLNRYVPALSLLPPGTKQILSGNVAGITYTGPSDSKAKAAFVDKNNIKSGHVAVYGRLVGLSPTSVCPVPTKLEGKILMPVVQPGEKLPADKGEHFQYNKFCLSIKTIDTTFKMIPTDLDGNVTSEFERLNELIEKSWFARWGSMPIKGSARFSGYDNSAYCSETCLMATKRTKYDAHCKDPKNAQLIASQKKAIDDFYAKNDVIRNYMVPVPDFQALIHASMFENPHILEDLLVLFPTQQAIRTFVNIASAKMSKESADPTKMVVFRSPSKFATLDGKYLTATQLVHLAASQKANMGYRGLFILSINTFVAPEKAPAVSVSYSLTLAVIDPNPVSVVIGHEPRMLEAATDESTRAASDWAAQAQASMRAIVPSFAAADVAPQVLTPEQLAEFKAAADHMDSSDDDEEPPAKMQRHK